jgi:hypothetical protein
MQQNVQQPLPSGLPSSYAGVAYPSQSAQPRLLPRPLLPTMPLLPDTAHGSAAHTAAPLPGSFLQHSLPPPAAVPPRHQPVPVSSAPHRVPPVRSTMETRKCTVCASVGQGGPWRRGPDGKATLCNACGVRFYRQQKALRAAAAATAEATGGQNARATSVQQPGPPRYAMLHLEHSLFLHHCPSVVFFITVWISVQCPFLVVLASAQADLTSDAVPVLLPLAGERRSRSTPTSATRPARPCQPTRALLPRRQSRRCRIVSVTRMWSYLLLLRSPHQQPTLPRHHRPHKVANRSFLRFRFQTCYLGGAFAAPSASASNSWIVSQKRMHVVFLSILAFEYCPVRDADSSPTASAAPTAASQANQNQRSTDTGRSLDRLVVDVAAVISFSCRICFLAGNFAYAALPKLIPLPFSYTTTTPHSPASWIFCAAVCEKSLSLLGSTIHVCCVCLAGCSLTPAIYSSDFGPNSMRRRDRAPRGLRCCNVQWDLLPACHAETPRC